MPIVFDNITFTGGILLVGDSGPVPLSDQYFQYTTLLLDGLGANGAQNNTFRDSSANNFTITRNGNTTQGSFTPFSHTNGYWSNFFDGTGDSLSIANATALNLSSGDFTIEFWVYPTSSGGSQQIFLAKDGISGSNYASYAMDMTSDNKPRIYLGDSRGATSHQPITAPTALTLNAWSHLAGVRSGNTLSLYVNGQLAVSATITVTPFDGGRALVLGSQGGGGSNYTGYMQSLRIVKGTALYTGNFTPSTTPLTAITGTSLLTCQSNRFIDNSPNNFAVTSAGNPMTSVFQPFVLYSEYDSSTMGGSMYFDGSGDFLSFSGLTIGTNAYTVEFWFYHTGTFSTAYAIFGTANSNALGIRINNSTTIAIDQQNVAQTTFTVPAIAPNTWNHIAVVRNSSNVTTVFLNGVRSTTGTVTMTTNYNAASDYIGRVSSNYYPGYLMDVRVSVGSAFYDPTQTTITVPTAPLTAISGTSLLLNGTNGGVIDNTSTGVVETLGTSQISTTQSKWGGSSLFFNGSGNYMLVPYSPSINLALGNFTVELWIYPTLSNTNQIFVQKDGRGGTNNSSYSLFVNNANRPMFLVGQSDRTNVFAQILSSTAYTLNAWNHIAGVRNGSTLTLYLNGQSVGTANLTFTPIDSGKPLWINGQDNGSTNFQGYMQGIRLTKGIARYTENFTPPTDY